MQPENENKKNLTFNCHRNKYEKIIVYDWHIIIESIFNTICFKNWRLVRKRRKNRDVKQGEIPTSARIGIMLIWEKVQR